MDTPSAVPYTTGRNRVVQCRNRCHDMIAGHRFFVKAFQTYPLAAHIEKVAIPSPDNLSDDALAAHCKRFVKTNYQPVNQLCWPFNINQFTGSEILTTTKPSQWINIHGIDSHATFGIFANHTISCI